MMGSDERESRRIAEEERAGNVEDLREIDRRYHAYPEAQRLHDQEAEAEFLQRQDREVIHDQVRAALDRRSDERYRLDVEPRAGGYALVRNPQTVTNVFDGADPVMAWKPTLGELQQQILADAAAHFTLKERTMDPLGTTDPLGRIESPKRPDDDLRIPDWPKVRQGTPPQAPQALKDEPGIMSRAYSWLREHITPQQARSLQEDQVLAMRIPPPTLKL